MTLIVGKTSFAFNLMNRYKSLFSDTLIIGVGNFTTRLVYFFLMPIYTVAMTAAEFGEADLLTNLAALLLPVLTLSISDGVFRFVLDRNEDPNVLLTVGISIIIKTAFVSLFACSIAYGVTHKLYWAVFYVYFISEAFRSLFAQFARGVGNVRDFSISGIISALVLFAITYVLVQRLKLGVSGYFLSFVVAHLTSIAYLLYKVPGIRHLTWTFSSPKLHELLVYSLPLIPNTLSWWATNVSSRYILAYNCGLALAGLYAAASKLPALVNIVTTVFQQSWQISSVKESSSQDRILFYSKVLNIYSSCVFSLGAIFILAVPLISKFVLKGDFYQAWIFSPLLLFSSVLGCFSVFWGNFYTVEKKSGEIMKTTIYGAITNIMLCFLLIPFFGVYGALCANVISFLVITLFRWIDSNRSFHLSFNKNRILILFILIFIESICMSVKDNRLFLIALLLAVTICCISGYSLWRTKDIKQ